MTLSLKHKQWITTDKQLKKVLKKCNNCWKLTNEGLLIFPYDNIENIKLKHRKSTFILNTNAISNINESVGHWISLHIDLKIKSAVLFDSLNNIKSNHPVVYAYLRTYCKNKNITLNVLKLQTQQNSSVTCGMHSVWFTHKSHKYNMDSLLKLSRVLSAYKVETREKYVLNAVDSLFFLNK